MDHQRGATGPYDAVDMVILSVVGIVGGARSIRAIVTVWNERTKYDDLMEGEKTFIRKD